MYMGFSPPVQTFFISILFGMVIGVLWDIDRVFKDKFKYKNIFKKIIFCIAVCILTICFFFVFTYAGFRVFVLFGEFIGVILYFCTITKFFYHILKIIFEVVGWFFLLIYKITKKFVNITVKNIKFIVVFFNTKIKKNKKNKKNKNNKNKEKTTCFYDVNKYIMKKIEKFIND